MLHLRCAEHHNSENAPNSDDDSIAGSKRKNMHPAIGSHADDELKYERDVRAYQGRYCANQDEGGRSIVAKKK